MRLVTAMIAVNANPKVSIMRKRLLILATLAAGCASLLAQTPAWQPAAGHPTLLLWPNGAPGAPPNPAPEIDTTTAKDNLIAGKPLIRLGNVSSPTLTLYAARDKNSGAAVVVFPGGGYRILAIDLEGTEVCDWLNSAGINCVLLKYRVPDSGPYPKSSAALQDAQRALGWCARTRSSGTSIRTASGSSAFPQARTLRPLSARTSISGSTIR